jgi:hypothetical protein
MNPEPSTFFQNIIGYGCQLHCFLTRSIISLRCWVTGSIFTSWNPVSEDIFYESMVNLRPRQNRSMQILDPSGSRSSQRNHLQVVRRRMNNWSETERAFRWNRLSVRLERLAQNFLRMASLSLDITNADVVLAILRESKVFLELTANQFVVMYAKKKNGEQ